ncbi:MAG: choice-of-anchor D domain-containing protein [Candidatus Eisenbacteria bacterium]|uniref:Choice-of-anchor D domain-containing protein n=1 Tax=Eiseniibacteriota bacterium TaxID=2212470 RepID=A0A538T2L7_UNCEI|nr:MAG: choice-of-anchor D domain-containing protein [Candidatus Eisenbacteria bacterium]
MLKHLGLLVVIAGSMAIIGCSDMGNPIRPKAEALLSSAALDFGVVAVTGVSTRTLTVRNSGTATLSGNAAVSCNGYQLIEGGGAFSIAPGASRAFVVRFSPSAVGSFPCTLDLGPNAPSVPITGAGAVQVPGALSFIAPDSLDFGTAMVGQVKTGAFQVFSIGTAPLLVNVVATSADYSIVSGGGLAEIPVGGFINVLVAFSPQGGLNRPGEVSVGPGLPDVVVKGFGTTVSYRNDIRAIFNARCDQACHTHIFRDPATGYSNLINTGYVIPFDPDNSYLYIRIITGQMPQGGPPLSQPDQNKFRSWILEGALNN